MISRERAFYKYFAALPLKENNTIIKTTNQILIKNKF